MNDCGMGVMYCACAVALVFEITHMQFFCNNAAIIMIMVVTFTTNFTSIKMLQFLIGSLACKAIKTKRNCWAFSTESIDHISKRPTFIVINRMTMFVSIDHI